MTGEEEMRSGRGSSLHWEEVSCWPAAIELAFSELCLKGIEPSFLRFCHFQYEVSDQFFDVVVRNLIIRRQERLSFRAHYSF